MMKHCEIIECDDSSTVIKKLRRENTYLKQTRSKLTGMVLSMNKELDGIVECTDNEIDKLHRQISNYKLYIDILEKRCGNY